MSNVYPPEFYRQMRRKQADQQVEATRQAILAEIRASGPRGTRVAPIAAGTGRHPSVIRRALQTLIADGLVTRTKNAFDGRVFHYHLNGGS